jgi:hypothetical protein
MAIQEYARFAGSGKGSISGQMTILAKISGIGLTGFESTRVGLAGSGSTRRQGAVLGIDPGPQSSAYAIWDGVAIKQKGEISNLALILKLNQLARDSGINALAIERMEGMGMAVARETFDTEHWAGRIAQAWLTGWGNPVVEEARYLDRVRRLDVKLHHTGRASGTDANIRAAIIGREGGKGTKKQPGPFFGVAGSHQWSAVAIAIYAFDMNRERQKKGEAI